MINRREFVAASGGLLFLAALGAVPASARTDTLRRIGGSPTKSVFDALQGEDFQIRVGASKRATLRLMAVRDRASRQSIEQFSLVFRGSDEDAIDGGLYRMEHVQSGRFQLRLDPSGRDAQGRLYRADFSLLL